MSEDGTISGWRNALGTSAEALASRPTAVYKGVTLVAAPGGPVLLAANFSEGTVDAYDGDLNLVGQLSDSHAPAGYFTAGPDDESHGLFGSLEPVRKNHEHDDNNDDDDHGHNH